LMKRLLALNNVFWVTGVLDLNSQMINTEIIFADSVNFFKDCL
jgi:hypothetical protein